jgi:DNA polymerase-3 subunit gamma/tau
MQTIGQAPPEVFTSLADKYRPRTFDDILGQPKLVSTLRRLESTTGLGGRAYYIAGPSGAGKTSVAKLIASCVAESWATWELTGREATAGELRSIVDRCYRGRPLGGKGFAIVVNECHGLSRGSIESLLDATDSGAIPPWVEWTFTTTIEGEDRLFDDQIDAHPLLSRCLELPLARRGLAEVFAARALEIATVEGLAGDATLANVLRLVKDKRNNLRAVLSAIDAGFLLS